MNIRIDDDVPLPQPDKPDTWVTGPQACRNCDGSGWFYQMDDTPCSCPEGLKREKEMRKAKAKHVEQLQRYPAETTYDAKGVPTVDCFLVGGPLNGRHGPIVGTAQVVELDIYAADGSVSSVELYELGDRKELGCRYWKATKA